MTILEAIYANYRITCEICKSNFELSAKSYTRFESARMFIQLGWQTVNDTVLCPDCIKDWQRELNDTGSTD